MTRLNPSTDDIIGLAGLALLSIGLAILSPTLALVIVGAILIGYSILPGGHA